MTESQKKFVTGLFHQFPAIVSIVFGALFLITTFGRIGLGPAFLISGAVALYGIWRQTHRHVEEDTNVKELLSIKRINPADLPLEFRFISTDTTLREVTAKVGSYSRTSQTENGLCYEYDLPYHAAVPIFPEGSASLDDKIRAVYFRKPREDDDSMAL